MSDPRFDPSRGTTLALAALLAIAALIPPETDGAALAGVAALAMLAALFAYGAPTLPRAALLLAPAAGLAALRARFADAPGEAVLPVAMPLLAVATGLIAAAIARAGKGSSSIWYGVVVAAGSLVGARAVYEAVFGFPAWAAAIRSDPAGIPDAARILGRLEQGRAYAGFPTPAAAAGFLVIALPITVFWLASRGRWRGLLLGAAGLQAAGLIATRSITAVAALFGAVVLAAALSRSRRLGIAAGALAIGLMLFATWRSAQVFSRATDDNPGSLRAGNVRIAAQIVRDHPYMGVGPGGYAEAFPRYRRSSDNESRHAHMTPLEWVAEWGVPVGGVSGVLFLAVFLGPLAFKPPGAVAAERGVAIGLAALALHNLIDFTALLPSVLLVGCVLRGSLTSAETRGATPVRGLRFLFLGAALCAGAIVAAAGFSDAALDRAREAAMGGDRREARSASATASRFAPWNADAAMFEAQAADAADDAERAVRLVPFRASAREVRAGVRLADGDVPGAYADLGIAAELNPMKPDYRRERDRIEAALPRAVAVGRAP